jgi:hypothetical protein
MIERLLARQVEAAAQIARQDKADAEATARLQQLNEDIKGI